MTPNIFAHKKLLLGLGLAFAVLGASSYFIQWTPVMAELDFRPVGLYLCLIGAGLFAAGLAVENWHGGVPWQKGLGVKLLPVLLVLTIFYINGTYFTFRQEAAVFDNGAVQLSGTLLLPRGTGPYPAVVMIHGAGSATRLGTFAEAKSLVQAGLAVLIYDKRGSGATIGGHPRFDGYDALAGDAVAAVHWLRGHPAVDPQRVGLWGTSEGGWTAPLAAAQLDDLAFLIIVSGGPVTPAEQGVFSLANKTLHGYSAADVAQAIELQRQYFDYLRTGQNQEELEAALKRAQDEPWFAAAGFTTDVADYDQLSDYENWNRDHLDTDVAPLLTQMDYPILFVLGANDWKVPSLLVQERVEGILANAGHPDYEITIFPEAAHNIVAAPDNCRFCLPDAITGAGAPSLPWFAPGYLDYVAAWVSARVTTAE